MTPTSTPAADTASSARRRRLSMSALLAAAALGPLLIGSVFYSHRAVIRASEAVLRGEAGAWTRQLGSRLREVPGPPTPAMLTALLEEAQQDGLRYVGYLSGDRRIEAGTPTTPFVASELKPGQLIWSGPLVRLATPMRSRGPRGAGPPRDGPPPEGPRPARLTWLVVEFEPRTWGELTRTSQTTVALAPVTGVALCLLALWVWRSTRRLLVIERESARARHMAALGEMSAVLAHEIRNPLTSLKGHSQLLTESLTGPGLEKARNKAERVVNEAVRLEQITNDLLDFVKQGELDRAPTDLGALVSQTASEIVPAERLRLQLPDESVVLSVDAGKLGQLIDNLVQNAVQAGDGPVEIALGIDGRQLVLSVRDHGPGIPAGQEERIFEPFVSTRVRGTGLGLAIARRIADRHGSALVAVNHPDGGALFRLTLPREQGND